jgi:enoyl-CoA hydratase/carnithine racemase
MAGFEMVANCDLVVAASTATFALPEVKRGIVPVAGCLPRLSRVLGLQRTTYLALTGKSVSANTLHDWGLVNEVVEPSRLRDHAIQLARTLCENSPDALIVGRQGIRLSWETGSVEDAVQFLADEPYSRLMSGANFKEGIKAFGEKRAPRWIDSKL